MPQTKQSQLRHRSNRLKLPAGVRHVETLQSGRYVIYQRPKNLAAGAWLARWMDLATKKQKQTRLGTADDFMDANGAEILTFDQAQRKAEAWFQECDKEASRASEGAPSHEGPFTVSDALTAYFADARRRGVRGLDRDERRANIWIFPLLGSLEVKRLTRERIEKWLEEMATSARKVRSKAPRPEGAHVPTPREFKVPRPPKPEKKAPEPPATDDEKRARRDSANRVLTVLKAALNFALDRKMPVGTSGEAWKLVKPFRMTTSARVRFLTIEDQKRLVNACCPDFRRLVQAALLTGGRYGELARVLVQDFDPTSGTLFLVGKGTGSGKPRKVVLTEEGQAFFREITMGRGASELLFLRDKVTRIKREEAGDAWAHTDQVRFMNAAYAAAGIDPVTFHELRHSYASMLVNRGVPLAYVAAQLGHSDTRMVEKHYGHLAPNALAESIRTLAPKLGITEPGNVAPIKIS